LINLKLAGREALVPLKLAGQEVLVREKLGNVAAADLIARFGAQLSSASTIDDVRIVESHRAGTYWAAWQNVPVREARFIAA
jgi:hypothetical protein